MNWLKDHIIIAFWTGTNEMSPSRQWHFEQLKQQCGCQILLITPENLPQYILPNFSLHPAYPYLSETHKSDYLRAYMMHHYGGGYCDVKMTTGDWNTCLDQLSNSDKWICGYAENDPNHVAYEPAKDIYYKLIGTSAMICKPNTPFTRLWLSQVDELLDLKLDELKKHPSTYPQDTKDSGSGYPIGWSEMLGQFFHKICADNVEHLLPILPRLTAIGNYR